MVQIYKLLCIAVSALLLLQSTDADSSEKEISPYLKKMGKIKNGRTAKAATSIGKEIKKLNEEFKDQLNSDYQASRDKDGIKIMPNAIKYNVVQPTAAVTKVVLNRAGKRIDSFVSDVQENYDKYKDGEKKLPIVGKASKTLMLSAAITKATKQQANNYIKKGISFLKNKDNTKSDNEKKDESDKKKEKNRKKKKDSKPDEEEYIE